MVAGVGGEVVADEGRQVLVGDDVLQARDVQASRALEDILVRPGGMLPSNPIREHIVPAVEEEAKAEQSRVLVGSRVAQDVHVARVRGLHDVRGGEVVKRNPLCVVGRVTVVGHSESSVGITPHQRDPGLGGRVDEAAVDPGRHVVLLLPGQFPIGHISFHLLINLDTSAYLGSGPFWRRTELCRTASLSLRHSSHRMFRRTCTKLTFTPSLWSKSHRTFRLVCRNFTLR